MNYNPLGLYEKLNVIRFIKSATKICETENSFSIKEKIKYKAMLKVPGEITIHYLRKPEENAASNPNLFTIQAEFKKLFPSVTDPLWISAGKRYFCYFDQKEGLHYVVFSNKGRLLLHLLTFHPQNYPLQVLEIVSKKFPTNEIHLLKMIKTKNHSFYEIVIRNDKGSNIFESFQFKNTSKGLQFVETIFCINDIIDLKNKIITTNEPSKN